MEAPAPVATGTGVGSGRCDSTSDDSNFRANSHSLFTIGLQAEPGVDGALALRAALKRLLRDHGLRCVFLEETRR